MTPIKQDDLLNMNDFHVSHARAHEGAFGILRSRWTLLSWGIMARKCTRAYSETIKKFDWLVYLGLLRHRQDGAYLIEENIQTVVPGRGMRDVESFSGTTESQLRSNEGGTKEDKMSKESAKKWEQVDPQILRL